MQQGSAYPLSKRCQALRLFGVSRGKLPQDGFDVSNITDLCIGGGCHTEAIWNGETRADQLTQVPRFAADDGEPRVVNSTQGDHESTLISRVFTRLWYASIRGMHLTSSSSFSI